MQRNGLKWAGSLARAYINNIRQYRIKIRIFLGASTTMGDRGAVAPTKESGRRYGGGGVMVRWRRRMKVIRVIKRSEQQRLVGGRRAGEWWREREVARKVERASERDIPRRSEKRGGREEI